MIGTKKVTGAGAIAASLDPTRAFQLSEMRIHLSAAGGAGLLTMTVNSVVGVEYDVKLLSLDMTAVTDYVWQPTNPLYFEQGDTIDVAWANANNRTYGLEFKFSPLT
jgi:hypothetical protein